MQQLPIPELEGYFIGDVICIPEAEYVKRNPVSSYSFFYQKLLTFAYDNGLTLKYVYDNGMSEYRISFVEDEEATGERARRRDELLSYTETGRPYIMKPRQIPKLTPYQEEIYQTILSRHKRKETWTKSLWKKISTKLKSWMTGVRSTLR